MNRLIVAGMLVLAGAFSACAAEVTPDMARTAMGNWRRSHGTFGMRMGKTVSEVRTVEKKGIRFHVVKMSDGGAILVPATTKKRPVVMLLEGDDFDENDENPLWDILVPDLGTAVAQPTLKTATPKTAAAPQKSIVEQQWDELLAEPLEFATEQRLLLQPHSFMTRCFALSDLYAGKMHALVYRQWKSRIKGRDWYDFEWYVRNRVPLDFKHLQMRAAEFNGIELTQEDFLESLREKLATADIEQVKQDVRPFLRNAEDLEIWSNDYFLQLATMIRFA